jgi:orotidine-5'-phosphate decarboxylase
MSSRFEGAGDHGPRVIVALDFALPREAEELAMQLDPLTCRLKVGKELFVRGGPILIERLQGRGFDVFLDLKFHDIPNTVAAACRAAADLGVWMVNVHALGGGGMMDAAREALEHCRDRPLLIAVTVLTSHNAGTLRQVGLEANPAELVGRLARLAHECGLDGVVCSAHEAPMLRSGEGDDFLLVTPGIRPAAAQDDQRRIMTPAAALRAGSDFLVIGRPITAAPDPLKALASIHAEIERL